MTDYATRVRTNWEFAAHRIRAARKRVAPIDRRRAGTLIVAGIALIVIVALLFDARVIAWSRTLPAGVEGFFGWLTRWGKSDWLLIPSGIVVVAVLLGDWKRVSRANAGAWFEIATFAAVLFTVVAATGIATDIIKPIVGRFRPEYVPGGGAFAFAPLSFGGYSHYSFPSGHATTMAAVAVMATFAPGIVTIPIVIAAGVVAVSRVIIGVHFPSDVVGGALVGFGLGYLILRLMTEAGIVYAVRGGVKRMRFGTLRRLRRGRRLSELFPALWTALRPSPRQRQIPPQDQP